MMGVPRKEQGVREKARIPTARPERRQSSGGVRREVSTGHRGFLALVIVPVVLMTGSVYLHTVAKNLGEKVGQLERQNARARAEADDLQARVTDLSRPARIRSLAREDLKMLDPSGEHLRTYDQTGEDEAQNGGEQAKEDAG